MSRPSDSGRRTHVGKPQKRHVAAGVIAKRPAFAKALAGGFPGRQGQRLFCFRRNVPGRAKPSYLLGAETWATDAEAAMLHLKLTWGHTAWQGWFAQDITDHRNWPGYGRCRPWPGDP